MSSRVSCAYVHIPACLSRAFAKTSLLIFAAVMVSVLSVLLNFTYAKEQHSMGCPRAVEEGPSNMTCPGDLAYTRFSTKTLQENMDPAWSVDYTTGEMQDLRDVFAVLFNGCTGIMAGANMSGDLKDASVSIPYGTIGASAFTFLVYVILFTLSAGSCNRDLLLYDYSCVLFPCLPSARRLLIVTRDAGTCPISASSLHW